MTETLPPGWCSAPLGALFNSISDGDHQPPPQAPSGVPFLVISDVREGRVDLSDARYVPESYFDALAPQRKPTQGDLLYTVTGSFGIPVFIDTDAPFCVQRHIAILRSCSETPARYVAHALSTRAAFQQACDVATGTAQKTVGLKHLRLITVPLAPAGEQERIVEAVASYLSRLDATTTLLDRVHRGLKRYRASVLKAAVEGRLVPTEAELATTGKRDYEPASALLSKTRPPPRPNRWNSRTSDTILGHGALAVGNPGTRLPPGWSWAPLVDVARMESGHTPSREHPEWWDGDVPWIGIADARAHDGRMIHNTTQHTNHDGLANSAARLLPAGTVCVSRTASVGYVVVMGSEMATSQDFVNWIPTTAVTSDWLRVVFTADREALRRFGKGTVHKTIYFPEWLSMHVAVPPLTEQERICAEVDRLLSDVDRFETIAAESQTRCDRLRQSILKWAFEGKLVDQDPNDEPASELLARIKAEQHKTTKPAPRRKASTTPA